MWRLHGDTGEYASLFVMMNDESINIVFPHWSFQSNRDSNIGALTISYPNRLMEALEAQISIPELRMFNPIS
jgi:hypothetical protein